MWPAIKHSLFILIHVLLKAYACEKHKTDYVLSISQTDKKQSSRTKVKQPLLPLKEKTRPVIFTFDEIA